MQFSRRAVQYQDRRGRRAAMHGSDQDLSHGRRRREGLYRGVSSAFADGFMGGSTGGRASGRSPFPGMQPLDASATTMKNASRFAGEAAATAITGRNSIDA